MSESERQIAESSNHKVERKGSPYAIDNLGKGQADGDFFPTALVVLDHSRQRLGVPRGQLGG